MTNAADNLAFDVMGDSWATTRQAFADQFTQEGSGFIYRRSQKGAAIRVSADERNRFIDDFDRNLRRGIWLMYVGLALALGGVILFSVLRGLDLSQASVFVGIGIFTIPYLAYNFWVWGAPARELAGRTPIAGERSPDDVRRLRFQRITYGQLGTAALAGVAIPFFGSARQDVFSGWNRLWLVFGGALVLFVAVQAFRRWRFEQEQSLSNLMPRFSNPSLASLTEDSAGSQSKAQLWRYLPLVIIVLGFALVAHTSAGQQLARQPNFWPVLMIGFGAWSLFTVGQGLTKGKVEPLVRGLQNTYERVTQPKRFWASMSWNALLGAFFFWIAFTSFREASNQAVQDKCYNQHSEFGEKESFDACTELIEGRERLTYLSMGDAYVYRAIADENLRDQSRALADYTQAIRLKPANGYAHLHRGIVFMNMMRLDQAVADFSRAHEIDPKSPWPLADRGMAYAWKNDRARAEADFAATRAIDRTNIVVLHGEGVLNMNAGNLEAAVENFTAALRQDPSDAWSIQTRADAYQQMGEFEKAKEDRRELMELSRR